MGGGFGGKETQANIPAALAALVAVKTGRSARLVYSKDDDMCSTGKRHAYRAEWEVGFDDEGRILAYKVQFYSDGGAAADLSTSVMERTMLHAALIGALWGLGHTLTILAVGSAIIVFKLTIPPRIGLGMELSVGLMLILLGVLNLTGILRRAIEWITIRRLGSGAHSHFLFGRWVVHTHDEDGESILIDSFSILGWTPQWWKQLGLFHILRPLFIGIVHGLAGSAAGARGPRVD
jgi:hypothetical protein